MRKDTKRLPKLESEQDLVYDSNPPPASKLCELCAARFRTDQKLIERCASSHKNRQVEEWSETTYFKPGQDPTSVKRGDVYRIWKPDDVIMHRSTVLILLYNGRSWQACKIEKVNNVPTNRRNYRHQWAHLHVHQSHEPCEKPNMHIEQAELHELTMYPAPDQVMAEDCMIDLERSYDIGNDDDYDFIYCGKLDSRSHKYATKKHIELYCA